MTGQQFLDVLFLRQSELAGCILAAADPRWARLQPPVHTSVVLRDRFRGALIGGAIGDAMGRPNEGRPTEVARERKVREYQSWHGWTRGPKGTITDDTQMTMWVAEAILASGVRAAEAGKGDLRDQLVDPDDLAQRFTRERIRGIGRATREFVRNYKDLGKPWHEAGVPSAGNGTAMRAAPVGLVHLADPYRIYRDSLLQSVVSHRDSMAIAAASCQAYAVARAAAAPPGSLAPLANRLDLCADLALLLDGLETPGYPLNGSTGVPSLHGRIGKELARFLTTGGDPFAFWHNGAYVLGSFPCALWCFLASAEDFEETLFTAVDGGHDADTVAAMACTLSGAYHGYSRLPQRLLADLEYHDRLLELADGLHELHRRLYGTS
jgi:ADP-ribosylglycohydrolase